tara:strand:- start:66 stop:305 length:240 start_codon:yes stop_codon:yes gene_type:complete
MSPLDRNQETKRERFHRIAANRMQNILTEMNRLSNCSNTAHYEYTEEDVQKIIKTLNEKFSQIKLSFKTGLNKTNKFKF